METHEAKKTEPDNILFGALKILQPDESAGPRVNVDTILLAHFARFPGRARAIELGCAQGTIALIIAMRRKLSRNGLAEPEKHPVANASTSSRENKATPIDAIDINPALIDLAQKNAELNELSGEVNFFVSDLREHRNNFRAGVYDAVVMNPPYDELHRSRPSPDDAIAAALHGASCDLPEIVTAAKYLLNNGGKFFLVMRAKRAAELFSLLRDHNLRPKRVRAVHPKPDREASVVLVEAVRASGDGLVIEPPLFICGPDGQYTESLLEFYNLGAGKCL
jgi:tRNA1(Val) A37 N6-methylase TrmN6